MRSSYQNCICPVVVASSSIQFQIEQRSNVFELSFFASNPKGHQTAVLLCGKLVIEQIFVACHSLLAGLSLYPLIASHAGNINKEEFLTGYGPGSR